VTLTDDPRPLTSSLSVAYDGGMGTVTVDPADLPGDIVFDLWVDGGEPVWLQRLVAGTAATLDLASHRASIADNGLRFVVTAEPADSPEPLVRSSGWPVLRGAMPTPLVEALITAPYAEEGIFAGMLALLDIAEAHRGFALNAHANGTGTPSEVVLHCEHVFSTLAGEAVAEDNSGVGKEGDFSGDDIVQYFGDDRTGMGSGTVAAPGYLRRLTSALADLEAEFDVFDALTCTSSLGTAVTDALEATKQFAAAPLETAPASTFDAAIMQVRGASHDDGAVGSADQTTLCAMAEVELLADFDLAPVAAGTD